MGAKSVSLYHVACAMCQGKVKVKVKVNVKVKARQGEGFVITKLGIISVRV